MAEERDSGAVRERIQRLMAAQHIRTPSELAGRAGVSKGGLLTFWRGDTATLRLGTLKKIADALHVTVAVLQGEEPEPDVEELLTVEVALDGEDLDVFHALASIRRLSATEVIEGELAEVARAREADQAVEAVVRSVKEARQRATSLRNDGEAPD